MLWMSQRRITDGLCLPGYDSAHWFMFCSLRRCTRRFSEIESLLLFTTKNHQSFYLYIYIFSKKKNPHPFYRKHLYANKGLIMRSSKPLVWKKKTTFWLTIINEWKRYLLLRFLKSPSLHYYTRKISKIRHKENSKFQES